MLDVALLGCGGSLPVPNRNLTSLLVSMNGSKILVDCGEGTQVSMKLMRSGFKNIDAIVITHFHADHVLGLPGLLLTIANSERKDPLTIIGPKGAVEVIKSLTIICPNLSYDLNIIECEKSEDNLINIGGIDISVLKVDHSIPCIGYSFFASRGREFKIEKAKDNKVPLKLWSLLQKGQKIEFEGKIYEPDMVLGDQREGIKVTYITDTRPNQSIVNFAQKSHLFICEGMYGDDDDINKAITNRHMTFREASNLAKMAEVEQLWLTHFSPSMDWPEKFIENATENFPKTKIGKDRMSLSISFK